MGALAKAIADEHAAKQCTPCSIDLLLGSLKPADRKELEEALALPVKALGHAPLARSIEKAFGVHVTTSTLGRHRLGQCRCGRS